ncbi:MAG: DMT family transporter [Chromatiales bacterium]|jgi:drug/metabolite transporter (DMT)-like permease
MVTILLYLACVLIWGTTWYAITLQLGVVTPEISLVYRFGLATLCLLVFARIRRTNLSLSARDHFFAMLQGLTMFGVNYALIYYGTQYISSGLVAVLFTTLTFMNIFNEHWFFGVRLRAATALAAALGLAGIGLIFLPELRQLGTSATVLHGTLIVLAGTYAASLGNMAAIRNTGTGLPIVSITVWGMSYGTACLAVMALLRGARFEFDPSPDYVFSLLYLAVFGSAAAFVAYLELIRRIGPGPAAYTSVVVPLVALALSTWLEGYVWTLTAAAGVVLVLTGNLIIVNGARRRSQPASATR